MIGRILQAFRWDFSFVRYTTSLLRNLFCCFRQAHIDQGTFVYQKLLSSPSCLYFIYIKNFVFRDLVSFF